MTNFGYIILTSLCIQYAWGIQKTEILPTIEPYNRTHCKIFFETSFNGLPQVYTAKLTIITEKTGNRESFKIENNLVKFKSCIPIIELDLEVEIILDPNRPAQGQSNHFKYDPLVNLSRTIEDHGCLTSDGILSGEIQMRENNKYFEVCLEKIEIVNKNHSNTNIIVRSIFFKKGNQKLIRKVTVDLIVCNNNTSINSTTSNSNSISETTLAVITITPALVLLGTLAVYFFYKRNKDIEDSKEESEVNPTYGDVAYSDYDYKSSELKNTNDYYDSEYTEDSQVTE